MGLLDEAIREHLELKRKRGDDPGDLARLEREALGPAVRQSQPVEAAQAALDEPAQAAAHPAAEAEPAAESPGQSTAPFDAEGAFGEADVPDAPPTEVAPAPPPPEPALDEPATPAPPPAAAEPDAPPVPPAEERPPAPEPEPSSEEDRPPAREGEEGDEDVLEETPEFLQETPDHDRLWFEQKPPRDFDFDG